jgi:hypothetical protein
LRIRQADQQRCRFPVVVELPQRGQHVGGAHLVRRARARADDRNPGRWALLGVARDVGDLARGPLGEEGVAQHGGLRAAQATHGVVVCEHCAEPLTADSLTKELGPGFPARLADREDVRARFGKRPD